MRAGIEQTDVTTTLFTESLDRIDSSGPSWEWPQSCVRDLHSIQCPQSDVWPATRR